MMMWSILLSRTCPCARAPPTATTTSTAETAPHQPTTFHARRATIPIRNPLTRSSLDALWPRDHDVAAEFVGACYGVAGAAQTNRQPAVPHGYQQVAALDDVVAGCVVGGLTRLGEVHLGDHHGCRAQLAE